jgi:putative ABC transport system permease protein
MLKNYLKIAYRNLLNQKIYSFINIAGLAIGITCFILIYMFVQDELSYHKFNSKYDRIYRIIEKVNSDGQGEESTSQPIPVGPTLLNDYPQYIKSFVRFFNYQQPNFALQVGDRKFNETRVFFADSTLFNVFDYKLEAGNPDKALAEPNSIVLSKELAKKYFGDENPLGKIIKLQGQIDIKVTGVFAELPAQSHIHFDCLISFGTVYSLNGAHYQERNFVWNPAWTYILLKKGIKPEMLEREFPNFVNKYYPQLIKNQVTNYLQPLRDIHLKSHLDYEIEPNSDISAVYIFSIVGFLILIIACINFMNLATAHSAKRAREVGMRKVLGAEKNQLIKQFLGESIVVSLISVVISVVLIPLLLPIFSSLANKELAFNPITHPGLLLVMIIVGFVVGIASGIYPAFFLSSTLPIATIKTNVQPKGGSAFLRKLLVVTQFAISLGLIIATFVIIKQLDYLQNADTGFDKEHQIIIPLKTPMLRYYKTLKDQFLLNSNVTNVTFMNEVIGENHNTHEINYEGMQAGKWIYMPGLMVDENFVPTFNLKIIAGRNYSKEFPGDDTLSIIINESMVNMLGWGPPEKALGKRFNTFGGHEVVIGVVKDFNFASLKEPIGPFFLSDMRPQFAPFFKKYMVVKIKPGNIKSTINYLDEKWSGIVTQLPFEFNFLNERLNSLYKSQDRLGKLIGYFSILAIIIACLGMFALATYSVERKFKEIGIRKVLGATSLEIVILFMKEFLMLVLIANVIAWPFSYYIMSNWLKDFAFRIDFPYYILVLSGIIAILISIFTVGFQSIKAASANPVKSLKYE